MITARLLQLYMFLLPLELSLGTIFGIDTIWKPYRLAAILIATVAIIELPSKRLDGYDKRLLGMFVIACALSIFWCLVGQPEPAFVLNAFIFVLVPFTMYFCLKFSVGSPKDLERLVRAFVIGAVIDGCYVSYEALILGQTDRPAGLSGKAPENLALHCGLALAFVLFPYVDRGSSRWFSIVFRVCAGAVLCFAVIASGTRAAWMGILLSSIVLSCIMATSRPQRRRLGRAVIPALLLIATGAALERGALRRVEGDDLVKEVDARLQGGDNLETGTGRTEIWRHAADAAATYYGVGGGFSGFMQRTYQRKGTFYMLKPIELEHGIGSHNVFLEVFVDYGPISLLLFFSCVGGLIAVLFRIARNAGGDLSGHGMLFALLFLIVCGCFRDLMGIPDFWAVMAVTSMFVQLHRSCPAVTRAGMVSSHQGPISIPKSTALTA